MSELHYAVTAGEQPKRINGVQYIASDDIKLVREAWYHDGAEYLKVFEDSDFDVLDYVQPFNDPSSVIVARGFNESLTGQEIYEKAYNTSIDLSTTSWDNTEKRYGALAGNVGRVSINITNPPSASYAETRHAFGGLLDFTFTCLIALGPLIPSTGRYGIACQSVFVGGVPAQTGIYFEAPNTLVLYGSLLGDASFNFNSAPENPTVRLAEVSLPSNPQSRFVIGATRIGNTVTLFLDDQRDSFTADDLAFHYAALEEQIVLGNCPGSASLGGALHVYGFVAHDRGMGAAQLSQHIANLGGVAFSAPTGLSYIRTDSLSDNNSAEAADYYAGNIYTLRTINASQSRFVIRKYDVFFVFIEEYTITISATTLRNLVDADNILQLNALVIDGDDAYVGGSSHSGRQAEGGVIKITNFASTDRTFSAVIRDSATSGLTIDRDKRVLYASRRGLRVSGITGNINGKIIAYDLYAAEVLSTTDTVVGDAITGLCYYQGYLFIVGRMNPSTTDYTLRIMDLSTMVLSTNIEIYEDFSLTTTGGLAIVNDNFYSFSLSDSDVIVFDIV